MDYDQRMQKYAGVRVTCAKCHSDQMQLMPQLSETGQDIWKCRICHKEDDPDIGGSEHKDPDHLVPGFNPSANADTYFKLWLTNAQELESKIWVKQVKVNEETLLVILPKDPIRNAFHKDMQDKLTFPLDMSDRLGFKYEGYRNNIVEEYDAKDLEYVGKGYFRLSSTLSTHVSKSSS